jgi:IclR family transcriptional regulator, acetate operon repressor
VATPPVKDQPSGTAIQKATRLLRTLVTSDLPLHLNDLAAATGLPKPSVHRLISQLEDISMVQRDISGKGYTVGPAWIGLSLDTLAAAGRRPAIRQIMLDLVGSINESCNLGILHDHEIVYIERVECNWPLRMHFQAGSRVPVHCTAAGKLFLSMMPHDKRGKLLRSLRLEKYTQNTLTSVAALESQCVEIRESGISINNEEHHCGLIGIAVPVLRTDGLMVASLAIHAPIFRMTLAEAERKEPMLRASAEQIARVVGLRSSRRTNRV